MKQLKDLGLGDCFRFVGGSRLVGQINNRTKDTIHYTMQNRQWISWNDGDDKTDWELEVELV